MKFIKYTDAQLEKLRFDQTPDGKIARKEIQRRKMCGYTDGTAIYRGVDAMGNPKANPYAR